MHFALHRAAISILAFLALTSSAFAQQTCPSGQSRLGGEEPCIPSQLFNYLYCLKQSGGGKIEVVERDDTTKARSLEVNIEGKGSGVVIKGEGIGGFKSAETTRVLKELNEKLDPSLTSNCKEFASPKVTHPNSLTHDPLPARVEYEKKFATVRSQIATLDSSFFAPQLAAILDDKVLSDALVDLNARLSILVTVFEKPATLPGARLLTRAEWDGLRALLDELAVLITEIDQTKALFVVNADMAASPSTNESVQGNARRRATTWTNDRLSEVEALLQKTQSKVSLKIVYFNKRP